MLNWLRKRRDDRKFYDELHGRYKAAIRENWATEDWLSKSVPEIYAPVFAAQSKILSELSDRLKEAA